MFNSRNGKRFGAIVIALGITFLANSAISFVANGGQIGRSGGPVPGFTPRPTQERSGGPVPGYTPRPAQERSGGPVPGFTPRP